MHTVDDLGENYIEPVPVDKRTEIVCPGCHLVRNRFTEECGNCWTGRSKFDIQAEAWAKRIETIKNVTDAFRYMGEVGKKAAAALAGLKFEELGEPL